jgi:hypothetical protein
MDHGIEELWFIRGVWIVTSQAMDGSWVDAEVGARKGFVLRIVALSAQFMDRFRG